MEGAIEGIPSIGFSLCDYSHEADFTAANLVVRRVIAAALEHTIPPGILLNVNIPKLPVDEIRGMKITRQAKGRWVEEFDERLDPQGRRYFWLTGKFQSADEGEDTDWWALQNGFVSICPVSFDLTAHHAMASLNEWPLHLPLRGVVL
jgi:5'-nucleotidase